MAKYEHLPIYKEAFDLTLYFEKVVRNFSRYHKYTLGTDLRNLSREILKMIISANNRTVKKDKLLSIREKLEELKVILRICREVRTFNNFDSFSYAIGCVVEISKQNEGWLKSQK
jgi:hypothetical protein|tara:strand:+ start:260 stop:604 length:345 start_codon:yes stop_codon:yes gene_type:complete